LKWLMSIKAPSGRLVRWSLKLQEYDMEIQHRPGRVHSNVDPLSRLEIVGVIIAQISTHPCEIISIDHQLKPLINPNLKEEWKKEQQAEFAYIIKKIKDEGTYKDYLLIDDILYRLKQKDMASRKDGKLHRLVVPTQFQNMILERMHNHISAGHLGIRRTYKRITIKYYWKRMYNSIVKWINQCEQCNIRKGHPSDLIGKFQPPIVNEPWELVALDIVGPFKKTKNKNTHIIL